MRVLFGALILALALASLSPASGQNYVLPVVTCTDAHDFKGQDAVTALKHLANDLGYDLAVRRSVHGVVQRDVRGWPAIAAFNAIATDLRCPAKIVEGIAIVSPLPSQRRRAEIRPDKRRPFSKPADGDKRVPRPRRSARASRTRYSLSEHPWQADRLVFPLEHVRARTVAAIIEKNWPGVWVLCEEGYVYPEPPHDQNYLFQVVQIYSFSTHTTSAPGAGVRTGYFRSK